MQPGQQEYQHFIPQFLLKNFSHPFVCPNTARTRKKCRKPHHEKKKHPGDPVLNCLDISSRGFSVQEYPVSRVCGLDDMYINLANTTKDRRRLEVKFSNLERDASQIYRRIVTAYGSGESQVCMTRTEKDLLRKFLFLLKYRGSQFYWTYYNAKSINDYKEDDKELLEAYMKKRGFHRPIDVWLESLETIIDIHMDAERTWEQHIGKKMYFSDAEFFIDRIGATYLAICTPENPEDEFILTDNSFNVYEGYVTGVQDETTGKFSQTSYPFHDFSTLSPRLMLVLRSTYLPEPLEDAIPEVKMEKRNLRMLYSTLKESNLEDLPVHKAVCEDMMKRIARRANEPGYEPVYHQGDRFSFKFFRIPNRHVRLINGLLLDHAFHGSRIVFNQKDVFLDQLEWFLTDPQAVGKVLDDENRSARLRYLLLLTNFMAGEGRDIQLRCDLSPIETTTDVESSRLRNIASMRMLEEMMTSNSNDIWTFDGIYKTLGGTQATLTEDTEQSILMVSFGIKISSWSRGLSETVRRRNHTRILNAYQRLPCRRFWMYLKRIRSLSAGVLEMLSHEHLSFRDDQNWRGPEDMLTYGQLNHDDRQV
ncbi:hypothetical protein BGZ61DRAFT_204369 [Ilyonectria robusta]|uniref:uncharacterized protein n=1 Tax=Ilyonectria robusta TaxID=1079257 RepID=UPI001E8EB1D2|nr:uncharacterized protein BGZ61DRAFT_204369 [Ilyonectria robusta]KAH8654365.1 hypothetical protein BGZ61DRAFT_204369 [Ilyonectria robusta]